MIVWLDKEDSIPVIALPKWRIERASIFYFILNAIMMEDSDRFTPDLLTSDHICSEPRSSSTHLFGHYPKKIKAKNKNSQSPTKKKKTHCITKNPLSKLQAIHFNRLTTHKSQCA